jgi:hypothetical protein
MEFVSVFSVHVMVFWDVTPCILVSSDVSEEPVTYIVDEKNEVAGTKFLGNMRTKRHVTAT